MWYFQSDVKRIPLIVQVLFWVHLWNKILCYNNFFMDKINLQNCNAFNLIIILINIYNHLFYDCAFISLPRNN